MADEALDSHLSACRRLVAASMFRMPGQAAPSASQHDFLNFRLAPPVGPLPAVHPQQAVGDSQPDAGPIMGYTTRVCKLDLTWEAMLDRKLVAAIRKWAAIILRRPPAFDLGRRADSAKPLGDQLPAMLKHVFSGRSQGTLHARAGPILRYIMWCDKNEVRPIARSLVDQNLVHGLRIAVASPHVRRQNEEPSTNPISCPNSRIADHGLQVAEHVNREGRSLQPLPFPQVDMPGDRQTA